MAGNSNSGRYRKSAAQLRLHGTFKAAQHGERAVESVVSGAPEKPSGLTDEQGWMWDNAVEELARIGVAKRIDTAHLIAMCQLWGLYCKAIIAAIKDPIDKDARIAVTSYFAAWQAAAGKCGLSPADRAKLEVPAEVKRDEFEDFLNKKA